MNCPACDRSLTPIQAGPITVDACQGGCGGLWFDNFELKRVDDPGEIAGESLLDIEFDLATEVDYQRRRSCPKCEGVVLMRHYFNQTRRVEVDTCPKCGGVWLDAGELAQIRKEKETVVDRKQAAGEYFKQVFQQDFIRTIGRNPGSAGPRA